MAGWLAALQDLVHRLKDLQTAATEQLQISENLEKERDELIGRLQEANAENHSLRQVGIHWYIAPRFILKRCQPGTI